MPYIEKKAEERLSPFINKLCDKVIELLSLAKASGKENQDLFVLIVGYMREIAKWVLVETSLNAVRQYQGERKIRYWIIKDIPGIIVNVMDELRDRIMVFNPSPYNIEILLAHHGDLKEYPVPADAGLLFRDTEELINMISQIGSPVEYNYDGAYGGLVNNALTTLMPRILIEFSRLSGQKFDWGMLSFLLIFWWHVKNEFYEQNARPYENAQISKNGDVEIYKDVLDLLGVEEVYPK